jgi:hypothetical protein
MMALISDIRRGPARHETATHFARLVTLIAWQQPCDLLTAIEIERVLDLRKQHCRQGINDGERSFIEFFKVLMTSSHRLQNYPDTRV